MMERCVPWNTGGEKTTMTTFYVPSWPMNPPNLIRSTPLRPESNSPEPPRPEVSTLPPLRREFGRSPLGARAATPQVRSATPLRLVSPTITTSSPSLQTGSISHSRLPSLSLARVRTPFMRQSPAPPNLNSYSVTSCERSTLTNQVRNIRSGTTVTPSTAATMVSPYASTALRDSRVHVLPGSSVIPAPLSVTYSALTKPSVAKGAGGTRAATPEHRPEECGKRVREWSAELCDIRRKQLELAREENGVLQQELDRCRTALQEKDARLKAVEHSLDLFGEILVLWLQTLSAVESKKVLNTLMSLLVKTDAKEAETGPEEPVHTPEVPKPSFPPAEAKPADPSLVIEKLEKASAELEKRVPTSPETQASKKVPPISAKVPPLRLDSVGSGMWMGGRQTAGEVYVE